MTRSPIWRAQPTAPGVAMIETATERPNQTGESVPVEPTSSESPQLGPVVMAAAVGGAFALSLGVYGRVHTPTGESISSLGFSSLLGMKAWLTTGAATLGLAQALSAMWMWGRLPGLGPAPNAVAASHRWLGTLAFLLSLPVAYHCLWGLGFQTTTPRVVIHSILGCAFYGALAAKLLLLRSERLPGWTLPAAGGLLVAILTGLWFTSSLWFFTNVAFPGW